MNQISVVSNQETNSLLNVIERLATDPNSDIEKLERMLAMQERVLAREAQMAFSSDMAGMQTELPQVAKSGKGHNDARYAKLEDVNEAIRPALQKYGFAVTFRTKQDALSVMVTAVLSHKGGHREETELVLPLDTSGNKNSVQAIGSTVSYGKRYALCALLNISTGDDADGANSDLEAAKVSLKNSENLEELQTTFAILWKTYEKDSPAKIELTKAKDARKKELQEKKNG